MADVATPPEQPLAHWLRLLWNAAPALHLHGGRADGPFISAGAIHLPVQPVWQQHRAAAAHAAAHLVYSPQRFPVDGLVPVARALLGLLEDARVEALAMRELPGLARLWRPLHRAAPGDGTGSPAGSEALLARLARALADPAYQDPHPWVAKGRRLFFLDQALGLPAVLTPAELRSVAMRLGHDLGQMRLPFNARGYRPVPAYRDDHRWMWPAEQLQQQQPPPAPTPAAAPDQPQPAWPLPDGAATLHPEWDRLIRRLRPDWARVTELPVAAAPAVGPADDGAAAALGRRLVGPLRGLARTRGRRGRAADGDGFHLDALLAWARDQRCGRHGDARVHLGPQRRAARVHVWLLVDGSASTGASLTPLLSGQATARTGQRGSVLQSAAQAAAATAAALQAMGMACTVAAFHSLGRNAVRLQLLQARGPAPDAGLARRLQALRPTGSTRLGATLRHASQRLGSGAADGRWVLLLSDGQPHDVDVHDPQYLVDDALQAVRAARQRGVRMACLTLGAQPQPEAQRIFGRAGTQAVGTLDALPRALRRLVG